MPRGDIAVTAASGTGDDATMTTGDMFDLELQFTGMLSNTDADDDDNDMPIMLMLMDAAAGEADADNGVDNISQMGYREGVDTGMVSGDSVYWEDIAFPAFRGTENTTLSFMISGVNIDAYSVDDDRLEVTLDMNSNLASDEDFDADSRPVSIARILQALDLDFTGDGKAFSINACDPQEVEDFEVDLIEGFRDGWKADNEILLMVSSGTIASKGTEKFEVDIDRAVDDELVLSVREDADDLDTGTLKITFNPATGNSGQELVLTAMFLRARGSDEKFGVSDKLVVGNYGACEGDKLFFPFVTSMTGWDTGIVVSNDSKVDGSCSLNWGNMDLDDDEMEALSTIDVDAKDFMSFLVSMQRGADYSGSVGVACTFSKATGYVFLSDSANGIGQGYLVMP